MSLLEASDLVQDPYQLPSFLKEGLGVVQEISSPHPCPSPKWGGEQGYRVLFFTAESAEAAEDPFGLQREALS